MLRGIEKKPFPSVEGLRNGQRLMKLRTPKIGELKVDLIFDGRVVRKLEDSGFIDRAYALQGIRSN